MAIFTVISGCSGYDGIGLGLERVIPETRTVCYIEREAFAAANLVSKIKAGLLAEALVHSDITTFRGEQWRGKVDLFHCGYPCQGFSVAGKRAGERDPRFLWPYVFRVVYTMRPRRVLFENVEGHVQVGLSSVLSDLEEIGYDCAFSIVSAEECGAPHRRKRVFILGELADSDGPRFDQWGRPESGALRDEARGPQPERLGDVELADRHGSRERECEGNESDKRGRTGDCGEENVVDSNCVGRRNADSRRETSTQSSNTVENVGDAARIRAGEPPDEVQPKSASGQARHESGSASSVELEHAAGLGRGAWRPEHEAHERGSGTAGTGTRERGSGEAVDDADYRHVGTDEEVRAGRDSAGDASGRDRTNDVANSECAERRAKAETRDERDRDDTRRQETPGGTGERGGDGHARELANTDQFNVDMGRCDAGEIRRDGPEPAGLQDGEPELGHANSQRREEFDAASEPTEAGRPGWPNAGHDRWPAGFGQPQFGWEPPRLVEKAIRSQPGLDRGFDRNSSRMDSDNRIDRLRLVGNGVCPATCALAYVTLSQELYKQRLERENTSNPDNLQS